MRNLLIKQVFKNLCIVTTLSTIGLTGCVPLVVGGAAAVAGFAATDRRTLGAQTEDKAIALKAKSRLPRIIGKNSRAHITSYNRKVLITGAVPNQATKDAATRTVQAISGVRSVENQMVMGPPTSLSSRSYDTYLTSKIKTALLQTNGLSSHAIKVVTEADTVFLMGIVTEREANIAAQIASQVAGVVKVVKVFELISEEQLANITKPVAPAPSPAKNYRGQR